MWNRSQGGWCRWKRTRRRRYTDAGVLHAASVELANLITSQHDDLGNSHPAESDTGHNVVAASYIASNYSSSSLFWS